MQNALRETIIYKASFGSEATRKYQRDLKRRQKQGWQLSSCTESGRDWANRPVLTAIYEKAGQGQPPALNVQNLQLLLSMLSPDERTGFEQEVQAVVNQWLARKATGR